ncbi:MAG: hypothetical protein M5U26_12160 [Planctomycetota bacterium]|nr:hypothetical protein [Planctomycetota bacterium]
MRHSAWADLAIPGVVHVHAVPSARLHASGAALPAVDHEAHVRAKRAGARCEAVLAARAAFVARRLDPRAEVRRHEAVLPRLFNVRQPVLDHVEAVLARRIEQLQVEDQRRRGLQRLHLFLEHRQIHAIAHPPGFAAFDKFEDLVGLARRIGSKAVHVLQNQRLLGRRFRIGRLIHLRMHLCGPEKHGQTQQPATMHDLLLAHLKHCRN